MCIDKQEVGCLSSAWILRSSCKLDCYDGGEIFFLMDAIWLKTARFKNMVLVWHISSMSSRTPNSTSACGYLLVSKRINCIEPLSLGFACTTALMGWVRSSMDAFVSEIRGCTLRMVLRIWKTLSSQGRKYLRLSPFIGFWVLV